MAFPAISDADTTSDVVTSNSDSWTLTYPANIAVGDLLLAFVATDGQESFTWPTDGSGWDDANYSSDGADSEGTCTSGFAGKVCLGSESGTFTLGISSVEQGCWVVFRIPAAAWFGTFATGVDAAPATTRTGDSANPDPPALDPGSWDVEDTLWLAFGACDRDATWDTAPTNYAFVHQASSGGANGAGLGVAERELAAASEDPGTFTLSTTEGWTAGLIAIRPAVAGPARVPRFTSYPQLLAH